ncbi:hypothetical protein ACFLTJ_04270 [Chloroflexota bacterium]
MRGNINTIVKFAIYGAIGFGIGLTIIALSDIEPWLVGLFLPGAIGGASLGWALGGWKKAWPLALAGAIGFGSGRGLTIILAFTFGWYGIGFQVIMGAIIGAIGGFSLGIALKNMAWARFLTLASAGGFSIGYVAYSQIIGQQAAGGPANIFIIWGFIGGAFLGAALGYLEKRRVAIQTSADN